METIKSWIGEKVRVKEEYIIKVEEVDEEKSTYDDDGNIIEEVYYDYITISTNSGLGGVLSGMERDIFEVLIDIYGVDLYKVRSEVGIDTLPEPTHQIIIKDGGYPFLWEAKYFEVIKPETF